MKRPLWVIRVSTTTLLGTILALSGCAGLNAPFQKTGDGSQAGAAGNNDEVARLVRYCDKLRDRGDLTMAVALCRRALERDPASEAALMSYARIMETMNTLRGAADAYRRVLALNPGHIEARYGLGKAYLRLGQYRLGKDQFKMALDSGTDDTRFHNGLGIAKDGLGEHEAAQEVYRSGLEQSQGSVALRTNLGLSLTLSGQLAEAVEVLSQAAVLPDATVATRQALVHAYGLVGNLQAAEEVALIDFSPAEARMQLARYESDRNAGGGEPANPSPQPDTTTAMTTPTGTPQRPITLTWLPTGHTSKPPLIPSPSCKTSSQEPFCQGKR